MPLNLDISINHLVGGLKKILHDSQIRLLTVTQMLAFREACVHVFIVSKHDCDSHGATGHVSPLSSTSPRLPPDINFSLLTVKHQHDIASDLLLNSETRKQKRIDRH